MKNRFYLVILLVVISFFKTNNPFLGFVVLVISAIIAAFVIAAFIKPNEVEKGFLDRVKKFFNN